MRNVKLSKRKNNCRCKRRNREIQKRGRMANSNCKDSISINTAGVNNELNLKLLEFKECPLEIVTDLGWRKRGKTHDIGIDYVDLLATNGLVYTVMKDKIDHISWLKTDCKPHHHDCRNHHGCGKECCRKHCDCKKHEDWENHCGCKKHEDWEKHCDCKKHEDWENHCGCKKHEDWEKHCDCKKHEDWEKHCDCKKHEDWENHCDCRKHEDWENHCDCKKHEDWEKHCDCKKHEDWENHCDCKKHHD